MYMSRGGYVSSAKRQRDILIDNRDSEHRVGRYENPQPARISQVVCCLREILLEPSPSHRLNAFTAHRPHWRLYDLALAVYAHCLLPCECPHPHLRNCQLHHRPLDCLLPRVPRVDRWRETLEEEV